MDGRAIAGCILGASLAACAPGDAPVRLSWGEAYRFEDPGDYHLPPPPLSEGAFPCSDCHDPEIPVNARRRELVLAHQEIRLEHDQQHRWCLDCHDANDRDHLRLASGELLGFEESHRLCGQCHGSQYKDWRAGVHGRRSGSWEGEKQYLLCVHCHDSHRPKFQPIEPLPPPLAPARTR